MGNTKLTTLEAISTSVIIVLAHLILILPKLILQSQGSGSIINIIYVSFVALFAIYILNKLYKNFECLDIFDVSEYLLGKPFKFIIGIIFICYQIFICSLLLRNTAENLRTMYFQSTPTPYLLFFIIITATIANKYGIKNVIRCNVIIVTLVLIALISLFPLSSQNFLYNRIFPILGYGTESIFITGLSNLSIFGNMLILLFIMPFLKNLKQFKKVSYWSVIISAFSILITVSTLFFLFPITISSGSNIPIYLETRTITFGKLVQRVDAFFILIWLFCILSYVSIILLSINYIFKKITNIQSTSTISYTFSGIIFGTCLIYKNLMQIRKLDFQSYKILPLTIALGLSFSILFFANIKKFISHKKEF